MKPNQVANALRQIAAKIEASKNPSWTLVANDLKQVVVKLASEVETVKIDSVERVGGSDAYPEFHVSGSWQGRPFVREIALEVAGRDMETAHISGENFEMPVDDFEGPGDFFEVVEGPMLQAIYDSPEFKALT